MSDVWRALITGPLHGLEDWVQAAQDAGWHAESFPLLTVENTGEPVWSETQAPDWIVITSSNAIESLAQAAEENPALRQANLACVGEATAKRAGELGLGEAVWPRPGAQDAEGLAETLIANAEPSRALWPRGDRARALGERLQAAGWQVDAPIVYRTTAVEFEGEPPDCDAVFFASPSAVEAWRPEEREAAPAAIAIGWTTFDALDSFSHRFSMALPLQAPTPASLTECLRSFFPSE